MFSTLESLNMPLLYLAPVVKKQIYSFVAVKDPLNFTSGKDSLPFFTIDVIVFVSSAKPLPFKKTLLKVKLQLHETYIYNKTFREQIYSFHITG